MSNKKYDSKEETIKHIERVQELGHKYIDKLTTNLLNHDKSKLESPEKEIFDEFIPKLKNCTYGSDEYKEYLKSMGVGLKHHYEHNSHHPEHHSEGKISNMPLWDITEMLLDWIGACERHDNGNIGKSIELNAERFNYSSELKDIMINTVMGMFKYTASVNIVNIPTSSDIVDEFYIYYGDTIDEFYDSLKIYSSSGKILERSKRLVFAHNILHDIFANGVREFEDYFSISKGYKDSLNSNENGLVILDNKLNSETVIEWRRNK